VHLDAPSSQIIDYHFPSSKIILPYAGSDLNVIWPIVDTLTRYFSICRAANSSQYTLGRAFLQETYHDVDYERSNFSVSQSLFNCNVTQDIIPIFPPGYIPPSTRHSLSGGAIAGVVLESMIGLAVLIALSIIFWRRRWA
jgi:hypothetical protein